MYLFFSKTSLYIKLCKRFSSDFASSCGAFYAFKKGHLLFATSSYKPSLTYFSESSTPIRELPMPYIGIESPDNFKKNASLGPILNLSAETDPNRVSELFQIIGVV